MRQTPSRVGASPISQARRNTADAYCALRLRCRARLHAGGLCGRHRRRPGAHLPQRHSGAQSLGRRPSRSCARRRWARARACVSNTACARRPAPRATASSNAGSPAGSRASPDRGALLGVTTEAGPLGELRLQLLKRFWLEAEGAAADPEPVPGASLAPAAAARPRHRPAASAVRPAVGRHLCAAGGGLFARLRPGRPHQPRVRRAGGRERLCRVPRVRASPAGDRALRRRSLLALVLALIAGTGLRRRHRGASCSRR